MLAATLLATCGAPPRDDASAASAAAESPLATTTTPALAVAPQRLAFGAVARGAPLDGHLTLANRSTELLWIDELQLDGAPARLRFAGADGVPTLVDARDETTGGEATAPTASRRLALRLAPGANATLDVSIVTDELASGPGNARLRIGFSNIAPATDDRLPAHSIAIPVEFILGAPAGSTPLVAQPAVIDFGNVFVGEVLHHEVLLSNPGPGDVVLTKVKNSCSCTASALEIDGRRFSAAELEQTDHLGTLSPGETARLEVELLTTRVARKQSSLHLSKVILVHTDDPSARPLAVSLRATISTPYFAEPETLDLGRVRVGASATAVARLSSDQLGEFRITSATSGCPEALRARIEREQEAPDARVAWRLHVELLPGAPLGTTLTQVELAVDDPRLRTIVVPVQFTIEPNVDFLDNRPDRLELLDFGQVVIGVGATLELVIENRHPEVPYRPGKVELARGRPTSTGIAVELIEKVAGTSYVVRLTAPPALGRATFFQGEVVITADHPEIPVKRFPYRGWYKPAGG